jgi:uncharacterized protein YdbL (DUF1318 family)
MATNHSIRYGYITRESAQYLGFAPANDVGGVINTGDGYLAALPRAMQHHIVQDANEATWRAAREHAEWLQEQCGI